MESMLLKGAKRGESSQFLGLGSMEGFLRNSWVWCTFFLYWGGGGGRGGAVEVMRKCFILMKKDGEKGYSGGEGIWSCL